MFVEVIYLAEEELDYTFLVARSPQLNEVFHR